jgi:hypothetical protein
VRGIPLSRSEGIVLCLAFLGLSGLVSCTAGDPPTRTVKFDQDMLELSISDVWQLERSTEEGLVFFQNELDDVRLHIAARIESFGFPLKLLAVKSLIGKELNLEYGGVSTRVSLGGNAMIKYSPDVTDEYDDALRMEEWVLAKPVGYGDIARVEISLTLPATTQSHSAIPMLVERLDKQVGDARIPRV